MDQKTYTAVVAMLNAYPQTSGNPDLTMATFEMATSGLSSQAVIEAAQRFTMGDVQGQSKTFAPSVAEFVTEARQRQEYINIKARPALPPPRYFPGQLAPFQVRQQKRLAENAHLPILYENKTYDEWRRLSMEKKLPTGATWCSLGIIYGPPKEQTIIKGGTE